jgi:serine protease AprX
VLIQVRDDRGIHNPTIVRALRWVAAQQEAFAIRVANMSFGGDPVAQLQGNPVDTAVAELVSRNVVVTVAAGNEGARRLVPPATAPEALTIGGLDDHNNFDHASVALWHSSYGLGAASIMKPELVAPSIWVAAPLLPGTAEAQEAAALFRRRGEAAAEARIADRRLITPHYQHVDGTSFAAGLVAGAVACLLQANPHLTPVQVRRILVQTADPVPGVPRERQGAGALAAGAAVAQTLAGRNPRPDGFPDPPHGREGTILFTLHDDSAQRVQVLGSWDGWQAPELPMEQVVPGFWQAAQPLPVMDRYQYKFLLDGRRWIADPANPTKAWDGFDGFNSVVVAAQTTTPLPGPARSEPGAYDRIH